ncbi:hypothetical protein P4S72_16590 [Vibrio sp. PP-XX7]
MADYECYPIWEILEDGVDNIDPDSLHLPQDIRDSLIHWSQRYDDTLDANNPQKSGFTSTELEDEFETEGKRLFEILKKRLSETYIVTYFSRKNP